jgi:5-methylcytosine-specific restriction endonuclease McrA
VDEVALDLQAAREHLSLCRLPRCPECRLAVDSTVAYIILTRTRLKPVRFPQQKPKPAPKPGLWAKGTKAILSPARVTTLARTLNVEPRCVYCGREDELTRDHIVPRAARSAGLKNARNLQILCWDCNHKKGAFWPVS